jgi:hypothetical protein
LTRGADAGGYYHELFLRGKTFLCKQMSRTKVKGTRFKAASSPEQEPDFYTMVRLCLRDSNRKVDCIVLESVLTLCIILSSLQNPVVLISPSNSSDEEMSHESERSAETNSLYPQGVTSVYEPLPIQYSNIVSSQAPPLPQLSSSYQPITAMSSFPFVDPMALTNADRVLDEAVAELFLHESAESDNLDEFVHDWDPNFNFVLRDDAQLGFMLEKLMED